jgi:hypothetical protein
MKTIALKTALIFCIIINSALAQEKEFLSMSMEGVYNGRNILVSQTYGVRGVGFCIVEVKVNGKLTTDEINASMFMIDLAQAGVRLNDKVKVEIKYRDSCTFPGKPLIMNPGALQKEDGIVTIEGKFYFENFLVSNPRIPNTNDHGVKEILVNGKPFKVDLNSDIFEINLISTALKEEWKDESRLTIQFKFQKGYDPLILNPKY